MPVFSYIAYPAAGEKDRLCRELVALDHCQVIPADNEDIVVLVTETSGTEEEKDLQARLKKIESLQSLAMTYGQTDGQTAEG